MAESEFDAPRWKDWLWWSFGFMPPAADVLMKKCGPMVGLLRHLYIPLTVLRGTSLAGTESTVIVAGDMRWPYLLARRFFIDEPTRESLKAVPFYKLNKVLRRFSSHVDLIVARVDRITARLFSRREYLTLPGSLSMVMTVPPSMPQLNRLNKNVREDVRRIRANSLSYEISDLDADFHEFYDQYHLPMLRNRHAAVAVVRNRFLLRRLTRDGGILWITRDGRRLAGCAFQRHGRLLHLVAAGIKEGRLDIMRDGALAAVYYFASCYAIQEGCTHIELGSTTPHLNDGALQYKRKWCPEIAMATNPSSTLMFWPLLNDPVAQFLARTPLIFCDGDKLSAVTALCGQKPRSSDEAVKLFSQLRVPGLRRFCVISLSGWQAIECPRVLEQIQLEMVQTFQPDNARQSF